MISVRKQAMDYLARREHSRAELEKKLALKGHTADEIGEALDKLVEQGLQSDERFVAMYVQYRASRGFGPRRIGQELQQRGVASALIDQYIWSDAAFWQKVLANVWQKKYHGEQPNDAESLATQRRFLLQRGFAAESVHELLLFNQ